MKTYRELFAEIYGDDVDHGRSIDLNRIVRAAQLDALREAISLCERCSIWHAKDDGSYGCIELISALADSVKERSGE